MTNKTTDSRRKLLKTIAVGSGAVVAGKSLPESWSKPVIDTVILPAHAATTDDSGTLPPEATTAAPISATYSRTNLVSPEPGSQGTDHVRACVMLDGTTATVTWQSIYSFGDAGDLSDSLLTGTLTDGSGTLYPSTSSCVDRGSFSATITDVTPTNLTLNIVGQRTISVVLPAASTCVAFIPDVELCGGGT